MSYQVKYRLDWETVAGETHDWRLDVLQWNYTGSIQTTIGADEPVTLEYIDSQDIYTPIVGSRLTMNFVVTDDVTYDDFSTLNDADGNLDARAYKVYLRYKKTTETDYNNYWVGFITAQDWREQFTTTPYTIEIVATDGLNLVNDNIVVTGDNEAPGNESRVGEYIFDVCHETGTQLDVRVYSDIEDSNNEPAVIETLVSNHAFYDKEFNPSKSKVEAAESILRAFNAKLFQSKGAWCITSCSNHIASISDNVENIRYWTYEYVDGSDDDSDPDQWETFANATLTSDENALVRIPNDFTPVQEDSNIIQRRPYFSIETKVSEQNGQVVNNNGFLTDDFVTDDTAEGVRFTNDVIIANNEEYVFANGNYGTSFDTTDTVYGGRSITTTRVNDTSGNSSNRDVWVDVQMTWGDFKKAGSNISIWLKSTWDDSDIQFVTTDVGIFIEWRERDYFCYNWGEERWEQRYSHNKQTEDAYWQQLQIDKPYSDADIWKRFDLNIAEPQFAVRSWFRNKNTDDSDTQLGIDDSDPVRLRIGTIRAYGDDDGKLYDADGKVTTKIDAIVLTYGSSEDNIEPFFERYQDSFSETYSYETDVYSDGPDFYRGKLSETQYHRNGVTEDQFLEQIVTQQKLNDYHVPLLFYNGTYVNRTDEPLHFVNKVLSNYTSASDTVSCIIKGLRVRPRSNQYILDCYRTNQSEDVFTTNYTKEDVYPGAENYTWRDEFNTYEYELDFSGISLPSDGINTTLSAAVSSGATQLPLTDASDFPTSGFVKIGTDVIRYTGKSGNNLTGVPSTGTYATTAHSSGDTVDAGIENYVQLNIEKLKDNDGNEEYGKWGHTFIGHIGDVPVPAIIISPNNGYKLNGLSVNTDNVTEAYNITFNTVGQNTFLSFDVIAPDYPEVDQFVIDADVDTQIGDGVRVIFDINDDGLTNASLGTGESSQITEIGLEGATDKIFYNVIPSSGRELEPSDVTFTVTSVKDGPNSTDTDVGGVINTSTIKKIKQGDQVAIEIPFVYSDVNPVYVKLDVDASSTAKAVGSTVTFTMNFSQAGDDFEEGSNTNYNWSLSKTSQAIKGDPGEYFLTAVEVSPDTGRFIQRGLTSVTESSDSITDTWVQFDRNASFVYIEGTLPSSTGSTTVSIDAETTTAEEASDLVDYKITYTLGGSAFSGSTDATLGNKADSGTTVSLLPGETQEFVVQLDAASGQQLNSSTTPTVPSALSFEGVSCSGDNGVYETCLYTFLITGPTTDDTDNGNTINWASTVVEDQDNIYTFRYNIEVNADDDASFNAVTNKTFIDVPFGDADLGDAIGDQTFTIVSSESSAQFSAADDVSVTTETGYTSTEAISGNVITATLSGNFPSTAPTTGVYETTVSVGGSASQKPSLEIEWQGLRGPSTIAGTDDIVFYYDWKVYLESEYTCFDVNDNGDLPRYGDIYSVSSNVTEVPSGASGKDKWEIQYNCGSNQNGRRRLTGFARYRITNGKVSSYSISAGTVTFTHPSDSTVSETFNLGIPQQGIMGTASSGASGYEVKTFRTLTQTEYDGLSDTDNNTYYLIVE